MDFELVQVVLVSVGGAVARRYRRAGWRGLALLPDVADEISWSAWGQGAQVESLAVRRWAGAGPAVCVHAHHVRTAAMNIVMGGGV